MSLVYRTSPGFRSSGVAQKMQPDIIAVQQGELKLLRCIPTFFIPFTENFGETQHTIANELSIGLVNTDGDVTKLGI